MRNKDNGKQTGGSGPREPTRAGEALEDPRRDGKEKTTMPAERWPWVETSVWTPRMLAALEHGVKGGSWYSLKDKLHTRANLEAAWHRVRQNKGASGVDRQTIGHFEANLEANLERLRQQLRDDTYTPQAVRRTWIDKPGSKEKRPLGIPTVRDRVAQMALLQVLEPIFEHGFAPQSYGFRPGRSCKDALRRVDQLVKEGFAWIVDADLKSYFDSIPKARLLARVGEKISDGSVLALVEKYLNQSVMDGLEKWTPESGTPQGAVISPLLSNIYLNPLDHLMAERGWEMVRYADDFIILCRDRGQAEAALQAVQDWTAKQGLTLHPVKTRLIDYSQPGGFDFLGYHFESRAERHLRWPRRKSLTKLKDTLRRKTRRTQGMSLECIIATVNLTLRGWFEYFKHSHRTTFPRLDSWIRMRLRSILRKRNKRRGRGRGADHKRWPNPYFDDLGLFSLTRAHKEQSSQSYCR